MKTFLIATLLLFTVLASFIQLPAQEQPRNVVWVHGLDGDESSWRHYEQIFTGERNINSLRKAYNTGNGLNPAALQVSNIIDSNLPGSATHPRNLAICHSMGGLVARNIDRLTPNGRQFGGLITVTSPNYGAPIANSLLNGSVTNAAHDAVKKLWAGPYASTLPLTWSLFALTLGHVNLVFTPTRIANLFVSNKKIQYLIGNPTTNSDLMVGSPTIESINSHTSTIPMISIWAQESSPVHWRMFGSSLDENVGEEKLVSQMRFARDIYNGNYIYNAALATTSVILGFFIPVIWISSPYYAWVASEWKKGSDWFDSSESIWCSLIKTSRIEYRTVNYCYYTCMGEWPETMVKSTQNNCMDYQWICQTYLATFIVNYPSDGLLPDYTQKLRGIPQGNIYLVNHANHIEVRNMSNSPGGDGTKARFNNIFSDRPDGDFFLTPTR